MQSHGESVGQIKQLRKKLLVRRQIKITLYIEIKQHATGINYLFKLKQTNVAHFSINTIV